MTENNHPCFRTEQQLAEGVAQWKSRSDPCGMYIKQLIFIIVSEPYYYTMRPNYFALQCYYASINFGLALQQQVAPDNDSQIVYRWLSPTGRQCGEVFDTPAALATHLKEAHFSSDTPRICRWKGCDRNGIPFPKQCNLVAHARVHTGEQPFTCKTCYKVFARSEKLKLHIRVHTGEKPFQCTFEKCDKVFASSSEQINHLRVHSTEKRYHCEYAGCNKKYSHPNSLRKHHKKDHENVGNTIRTSSTDESIDSEFFEVGESNKENDG